MDQLACQKDAELCRSRIADWEQRLADAGTHQDSLTAAIRDLEARDGEILRAIQEVKDQTRRSRDAVREKEAAIQAAAGRRMERQAAETKAQAAARAAAENREDASREMARLSERKSAAEGEYDQLAAKLWDEYQLTPHRGRQILRGVCQPGRPAGPGGRGARQDAGPGQRQRGGRGGIPGGPRPLREP